MRLNQAAAWLNRQEKQAVTPINKSLLDRAALPTTLPGEVRELLNKALALSRRYENSLETPEILVRAALILHAQADLPGAQAALKSAADFYFIHGSPHRHAVTSLMLGYVDWLLNQTGSALAHWREARASLQRCRARAVREPSRSDHALQSDDLSWYEDRLRELDGEEALIPQHVTAWLNLYDPVSLSLGMGSLVDKLYDAVRSADLPALTAVAETARRDAARELDPRAAAYLLAQAGAALLITWQAQSALSYLRQSAGLCPPLSHQSAVITWLKALAEWQIPEHRRDALVSSRRAMDALAEQALSADRKDLQARKAWAAAARPALLTACERLFTLFAPDLVQ